MSALRSLFALACLILIGPAVLAAQPAGGQPLPTASPVLRTQEDGSVLVEARSYRATIGADGNLHSLRVGDTEMLDDQVAISLGAFFYAEAPRKLSQVAIIGPGVVRATDGVYTILYRFHRQEARIALIGGGRGPAPFFVVLSPHIAVVSNLRTGEAAAAPASEAWGDVRVSAAGGSYLELIGGSRVWGPWLGRQVWEVSGVPPGERVEIHLRAGLGPPPKPALEQLVGAAARVRPQSALVPVDEPIELQVTVENRSERVLSANASMELAASRTDHVIYATVPLEVPPKQTAGVTFRSRVDLPDFYRGRITISAEGRELAVASAVAGYRVAEIAASATAPADFADFWQRVREEVGEQPPLYHLTLAEDRSRPGAAVWVAEYLSIGDKTISGWYVSPTADGPHPAVLYLPGYGARPFDPPVALAQQGYVVLAIDMRGNPVDRPRAHPFEDYCTLGIESPDTYVYREIVGHAWRGLHLLASRPEVDPDRIAVLGVSDGGAAGLMLAALSPRVKVVAADAPMLCDFPLSLRAAAWPYTEIVRYLQRNPGRAAEVRQTLSYFDLVSFAPAIQRPVLLSSGFLDPVSLPAAVYAVYNRIPGPKEIRTFPLAGHEGGGSELWEYKLAWLAKNLGAAPAPPAAP